MTFDAHRLFTHEDFQYWFVRDDNVRDELAAMVEQATGEELGSDAESLDLLESFLLSRYGSPEQITALDQRGVLDAAARHIGFVFELGIEGAHWAVDLEHPDNLYYQLPTIRFADGSAECPLALVTTALDRRTGSTLHELFDVLVEDYG